MKKMLALSLCVLFGGSMLMVAGCTPKPETSAPAVEESAPAMMETPSMDMTPAAVETPAAVPAEE